jgi:hypothetical protein
MATHLVAALVLAAGVALAAGPLRGAALGLTVAAQSPAPVKERSKSLIGSVIEDCGF